jgi:hypothetical protein
MGSVIAAVRLLFCAWKKKFHYAYAAHAGNRLHGLDALGAAGLKGDYLCSRRTVGEPVTWAV